MINPRNQPVLQGPFTKENHGNIAVYLFFSGSTLVQIYCNMKVYSRFGFEDLSKIQRYILNEVLPKVYDDDVFF